MSALPSLTIRTTTLSFYGTFRHPYIWDNSNCCKKFFWFLNSNACAFCSDKICFVLDKMNFVSGEKILSVTKIICPGQNILSMAKKFISDTCKSLKITFPDEKVHFYSKEVIFMDSCTVEINFLVIDKIFCPGQSIFVMENIFCQRQNSFCLGGHTYIT